MTKDFSRWRYPLVLAFIIAMASTAYGQGLTVRKDGLLVHDGKPFQGIGVNYFDAFYRTLKDPNTTSYEQGFGELSRRHIPFCRIMAGGFWPIEQAHYTKDPVGFFARFDKVVRSAERNHVGLILSLFWNPSTVPDLVHEPVNAWGDSGSKTIAYMRRYVQDVVTRYRTSPAIWGWEFGNEYALGADLPNAAENRPPVVTSAGTPAARTAEDEWHYPDLATAYALFAKEVRRYDRSRIIESGDSVLRESAWHNRHEHTWQSDTSVQQAELLEEIDRAPIDVLSVHAYGADADRLSQYQIWAREARQPLFVGEFGVESKTPNAQSVFRHILDTIEHLDHAFAALWVYDFDGQADTWNVTSAGPRAWQLDAIEAANQRLAH